MQSSKRLILLISADRQWQAVVGEALGPLGDVHLVESEESLSNIRESLSRHQPYEIIVVDVGTVGDRKYPSLVSDIRAEQREARIVVASAAPTWRQAKDAFHAGAIDYIRKSLDKKELSAVFQEVLKKRLPPWQPDDYYLTTVHNEP
jgi:DNA-binding NtrC family response regulator